MSGENAFEYIDFYDFSQSDDEPEFLRSELQDDHTLKMDTSSTEISELVLPSGAHARRIGRSRQVRRLGDR